MLGTSDAVANYISSASTHIHSAIVFLRASPLIAKKSVVAACCGVTSSLSGGYDKPNDSGVPVAFSLFTFRCEWLVCCEYKFPVVGLCFCTSTGNYEVIMLPVLHHNRVLCRHQCSSFNFNFTTYVRKKGRLVNMYGGEYNHYVLVRVANCMHGQHVHIETLTIQ